MNGLDFYSKIEPILGIKEAAYRLYLVFLDEIDQLNFSGNKALDFGCGNGNFAKVLSENFDVIGLDKSYEMVKVATKNKIKAYNKTLKDINDKFDLITAVNDVLNYMNVNELKRFFKDSCNALKQGGYLIFDINTKFGFNDIANGVLHEKDRDNHLIIDANFDGKKLTTVMIYFEKESDKYLKSENKIVQFYHDKKTFCPINGLKLIKKKDINLYSDTKPDKSVLIFQKI